MSTIIVIDVREVNSLKAQAAEVDLLAAFPDLVDELFSQVVVVGSPSAASAVAYSSGEIGDVSTTIVVIIFTATITSPGGDYTLGATIKVNGASVTISSAALQSDNLTIRYTLASAADINDEITYTYSSGAGDLQDSSGNDLESISETNVTNNIGTHWYFDTEEDSAHLAGE